MRTSPTLGQWLKLRRKSLGLTQKELAQPAGWAEITLRKIEAGDLPPSAALVASLSRALGIAGADLPGLLSPVRVAGDDVSTRARLLRPQRPNNLPAQLTPLIGRDHDIAAVRRRLIADGARLVTLLGPPSVGNTRLAQSKRPSRAPAQGTQNDLRESHTSDKVRQALRCSVVGHGS